MPAQDEVAEFASLLRELKGRTDRSYGSLARRLHMNTSTLHRYCAGDAVPVDFAPVERFAALCGATDAERLELHRRWLRAAEARRRPRAGSETPRRTDASGAAGTPGGADRPGTAGTSSKAGTPGTTDTPEATGTPGGADTPGTAGTPGAAGTPGTAGTPGAAGAPGKAGTPGATDTPEASDAPSETGTRGATDIPGTACASGEAGTPGAKHTPGTAGTPGGADTPGTAGASGEADAPRGADTPEASDPPGEAGTPGATDTSGTADAPGEASRRPAAAGRGSEPDASPEGTAPHASPDGEGQHRTESGDAHPAAQAPPPGRPGTATRGDRPAGPARGEQPDGRRNDASADAGSAPAGGRADADDGHVVTGPVGHPTAPPSRRWRRKRVAVAAAAMCALLATVGSLSFLPDDRRTATGNGTVGAAEETDGSGSGDGAGPARSVAPSRSPSSKSPSPSPSPSVRRSGGNSEPSKAPRPSNSPTPPDPAPAGPPPLTWSVDSHAWAYGCGHDYVVAKPPAQVPPPPAPQDARTWAATQGAVHGGETLVELSVQGRSDTAVVLTALRVRVAGRSAPASGNAYAMDQGCGGALTPRYFDVDLDTDRPIARAVAGNDAGEPIPAVRMPYRVSATDPEVLMVTARTEGCDCRWYLELDWSSQGRTGTVRIDDRGRPFRTSAVEGLPHYEYDTLNRSWRTRTG
ncbi:helix-turn-helix domain-containing protein [Streptomyces pseudogriseolus]|uniref:helix-turn-helix domain-containing protein n=1 Tax=Streptomyces pseudogriseolus TaxID=36817 RepID=UPI003FA24ABA